jgi:hypothetical protein
LDEPLILPKKGPPFPQREEEIWRKETRENKIRSILDENKKREFEVLSNPDNKKRSRLVR